MRARVTIATKVYLDPTQCNRLGCMRLLRHSRLSQYSSYTLDRSHNTDHRLLCLLPIEPLQQGLSVLERCKLDVWKYSLCRQYFR